jgi:hypothetical protein
MDLRDELDAVIEAFLVGRIRYSEFHKAWWDSYINRSADLKRFTLEESDHYGAVRTRYARGVRDSRTEIAPGSSEAAVRFSGRLERGTDGRGAACATA